VGAEIELNLLLNTPEDAFAIFQQLLYSWVQYLVLHRQTSGQWIEYDTAVNVLQRCMSSSNWKQLLFSFQLKTCIENRASILHVPGSLLAAVDTQYIQPLQTILYPQFTLQWKNAVKRRLEPFHEELMQVTWHPSRVEAMLEAGIEPWDN
jgi:hypothetical protein